MDKETRISRVHTIVSVLGLLGVIFGFYVADAFLAWPSVLGYAAAGGFMFLLSYKFTLAQVKKEKRNENRGTYYYIGATTLFVICWIISGFYCSGSSDNEFSAQLLTERGCRNGSNIEIKFYFAFFALFLLGMRTALNSDEE